MTMHYKIMHFSTTHLFAYVMIAKLNPGNYRRYVTDAKLYFNIYEFSDNRIDTAHVYTNTGTLSVIYESVR
jgi:hypothetical protein